MLAFVVVLVKGLLSCGFVMEKCSNSSRTLACASKNVVRVELLISWAEYQVLLGSLAT